MFRYIRDMKVTSPYCEILKIRAWQAILLSPPIKCDPAFLSGTFPDRKPILWSYTPYASKRNRIWTGVKNANWLEKCFQPHRISIQESHKGLGTTWDREIYRSPTSQQPDMPSASSPFNSSTYQLDTTYRNVQRGNKKTLLSAIWEKGFYQLGIYRSGEESDAG